MANLSSDWGVKLQVILLDGENVCINLYMHTANLPSSHDLDHRRRAGAVLESLCSCRYPYGPMVRDMSPQPPLSSPNRIPSAQNPSIHPSSQPYLKPTCTLSPITDSTTSIAHDASASRMHGACHTVFVLAPRTALARIQPRRRATYGALIGGWVLGESSGRVMRCARGRGWGLVRLR